jgi:hypothetical protein
MAKRYEFANKNSEVREEVCKGLATRLGQKIVTVYDPLMLRPGCVLYPGNGNIYWNRGGGGGILPGGFGKMGLGVTMQNTANNQSLKNSKHTYTILSDDATQLKNDKGVYGNGVPDKYHSADKAECNTLQRLLGGEKRTLDTKTNQTYWKRGCVMNGNRVYWNPCDKDSNKCGYRNHGNSVFVEGSMFKECIKKCKNKDCKAKCSFPIGKNRWIWNSGSSNQWSTERLKREKNYRFYHDHCTGKYKTLDACKEAQTAIRVCKDGNRGSRGFFSTTKFTHYTQMGWCLNKYKYRGQREGGLANGLQSRLMIKAHVDAITKNVRNTNRYSHGYIGGVKEL